MPQLTFEIPDQLLGEFYMAVGRVLNQSRDYSAEEGPIEWGTTASDSQRAHMAWRKFSPKAQAMFSLLMENPGVAMSADDIASSIGLANGRHALAGLVAWPSRQCAELGMVPPFRFEGPTAPGETGSYWMDPETAEIFKKAQER